MVQLVPTLADVPLQAEATAGTHVRRTMLAGHGQHLCPPVHQRWSRCCCRGLLRFPTHHRMVLPQLVGHLYAYISQSTVDDSKFIQNDCLIACMFGTYHHCTFTLVDSEVS